MTDSTHAAGPQPDGDVGRATRGWDAFLTERDRRLLSATTWAKSSPFGLGTAPAVVVVDAYYASVGDRREPLLDSVSRWPASCGLDGWKALDRMADLLDRARECGIEIIYLTGLDDDPVPWSPKARPARGVSPGATRRRGAYSDDPKVGRRELQIVTEVAPQHGETVLAKATPSGLSGTPLDVLLRSRYRDTVIVVGEATSGCVRATAVDACALGYRVAVVEDCTFDRLQASHWMSLFDLDQKYADVMDADAVEDYLRRLTAVRPHSPKNASTRNASIEA